MWQLVKRNKTVLIYTGLIIGLCLAYWPIRTMLIDQTPYFVITLGNLPLIVVLCYPLWAIIAIQLGKNNAKLIWGIYLAGLVVLSLTFRLAGIKSIFG